MPKSLLVALIVLALATGGLWIWIFVQRAKNTASLLQKQSISQVSESNLALSADLKPPYEPKEGERSPLRVVSDIWEKKNGVWSKRVWDKIGEAHMISNDSWTVSGKVEELEGDNTAKFSFAQNCTTALTDNAGQVCGEATYGVNPDMIAVYYSVWDKDLNLNQGKIGWKASMADLGTGDLVILWTTKDGLLSGKGIVDISVKQ